MTGAGLRDGSLSTLALVFSTAAFFFSAGFSTGFTGSWMILADSSFLDFLTAFLGFLELEIDFQDPFVDYPQILKLAHSFNRSVYDASYISLAKKNRVDFITGDKRLFNAVKDQLKWVKWIGTDEYS